MSQQLFCLVLDRKTLAKLEDSADAYEAEFLVAETSIDWISQIAEKLEKGERLCGEWGHPLLDHLDPKDRLKRISHIAERNIAIIVKSLEVISHSCVRLMFSVTEKTLAYLENTKAPFVLGSRKIADKAVDGSIKRIVQIYALDILSADNLHTPIPNWILQELHPELITTEENTMENVNTEQTLETITLATGESLIPQGIERETELQKIKDDASIQHQEAEFNQPSVGGMIIEEQEYGARVLKISPVVNNHKETLKDVLDVMVINAAAGNTPSIITEAEADVVRQTKIDLGECLELIDAVVFGDTVELQDALSDKRVTMNGFATFLPISLSDNFAITRDMLFTRFDVTLHNAVRTQEKYRAKGVETYIAQSLVNGNSYFANKVAEDVTGNDGEFYPRDKFLKSINYKKENFSPIDGLFDPTDTNAVTARWNVLRSMLEKFIDNTDAKVAELLDPPKNETI